MFSQFKLRGLWHHSNFVKLWAGSTISLFGSQVTFLALPFTAALTLHASPPQMGLLAAANTAPILLVGLFAGVWVDRMRRRPLLITADIGRALLLVSVPCVAFFHLLHIEYLYCVAFFVGLLTMFFNVAYGAFLPSLIEREDLIEGNSKLQASSSLADLAGPALAGMLVQILTAPFALIVDALSFLLSAAAFLSLRIHEPARATKTAYFWDELTEGLRFTFKSVLLRSLACSTSTLNFTGGVFGALLILYITHELALGAIFFGVMYTIGSVGGVVGALLGQRLTRRFGTARVTFVSALLIAVGWLLVALAHGSLAIAFIVVGMLLAGLGNTLFNVTAQTLIQTVTPAHLLGRVNASSVFIGQGSLPLGAVLGGALGAFIGLQATLLAATLIRFILLALFLVPLWRHDSSSLP